MNVPQKLTLFTNIHIAGTLSQEVNNIIQEFTWQTGDISPTYPKVHNFLHYWKDNIDAVINDVVLSTSTSHTYRRVDFDWRY